MPDEPDVIEEQLRPWVAGNPGFVHPHLPFRICDWQRDYGYFATIEQARTALAAMPDSAIVPAPREDDAAHNFVAIWLELAEIRAALDELHARAAAHDRHASSLVRRVRELQQAAGR